VCFCGQGAARPVSLGVASPDPVPVFIAGESPRSAYPKYPRMEWPRKSHQFWLTRRINNRTVPVSWQARGTLQERAKFSFDWVADHLAIRA